MRLGQRRGDLAHDVDDAPRRLGAIEADEFLEIESLEILHRVIEEPSGVRP